jgi:hypothetical protein
MNKNIALFAIVLLSACAAQDRAPTQDTEQAVRDFIDVRELAEADQMRSSNRDSWHKIDQNFIIYEASKETYLLEFVRRCYELDQYPVVPDERKSGNLIRARFDTVRGCRIAKLFPLTEADAAELKAIGESPGSRN